MTDFRPKLSHLIVLAALLLTGCWWLARAAARWVEDQ